MTSFTHILYIFKSSVYFHNLKNSGKIHSTIGNYAYVSRSLQHGLYSNTAAHKVLCPCSFINKFKLSKHSCIWDFSLGWSSPHISQNLVPQLLAAIWTKTECMDFLMVPIAALLSKFMFTILLPIILTWHQTAFIMLDVYRSDFGSIYSAG